METCVYHVHCDFFFRRLHNKIKNKSEIFSSSKITNTTERKCIKKNLFQMGTSVMIFASFFSLHLSKRSLKFITNTDTSDPSFHYGVELGN